MKHSVQSVLFFAAVVVMSSPLLWWYTAYVVMLSATGGERFGISQTDKPVSYNLLEFSEWQDGPGECTPSDIHSFNNDYTILAHRVGRGYGVFTRFTYYEARYLTPNGEVRITHASGPELLIAPRYAILCAMTIASLFGAFLLFYASWKLSQEDSRHPRSIGSEESSWCRG